MSGYAVSGFVDGFFKGRDWRDQKEDRKKNRARQERLDGMGAEKHDALMGQYEQMSGLRDSAEARAKQSHGYNMGKLEHEQSERDRIQKRQADEAAMWQDASKGIEIAGAMGLAPEDMPQPRAPEYPVGQLASTRSERVQPQASTVQPQLGYGASPQPTSPEMQVMPPQQVPGGQVLSSSASTDGLNGGLSFSPMRDGVGFDQLNDPQRAASPVSGGGAAPQSDSPVQGSFGAIPNAQGEVTGTDVSATPEMAAAAPAQQMEAASMTMDAALGAAHDPSVALGLPPGQNMTEKQYNRAETAFKDHYIENVLPTAMKFYVSRGELEKAQGLMELMESYEGQEIIKMNARAATSLSVGDIDGAARHAMQAMQKAGTLDPSLELDEEATKFRKDGQGRPIGGVVVYKDKQGNRFERTFDTADEFIQDAILGSSPIMMVEQAFKGAPKPLSTPGKVQADINAGLLPKNTKLRSPQVVVNTGDEVDPRPIVDKPHKGFQRRFDKESNSYVDEPIPGSDPSVDREGDELKSQQAVANYQRKFDLVNSKIDEAISSLDENGRWVAGMGSVLSFLPESEARNFAATVDTIKANLGFEELQAMRDSSPTGGALGSITEREIAFLQAIQGNLDTAQDPDQVRKVLMDIKERRTEFQKERERILGIGGGDAEQDTPPDDPATIQDEPITTPSINNDAEYDALPSGTVFIAPDGSKRRKP